MSTIPEDYNKGGFYTFVGVMVFVVGFFIVLILLMPTMDLGQNIEGSERADGAVVEGEVQTTDEDDVEERMDSLGTTEEEPEVAPESEEEE